MVLKLGTKNFTKITPLLVAELGQVHDGSEGIAHGLIDAIASTGIDSIKFQIHISSEESSKQDIFRHPFSYVDKSRFDYWSRIQFDFDQWVRLFKHAKDKDLIVGASVFSLKALDWCLQLQPDYLKIGSGDIQFLPLLNNVSQSNYPVIVSSGLSDEQDTNRVMDIFSSQIDSDIFALLACVSKYPTPLDEIPFHRIKYIEDTFNVTSGLSDHSGSLFSAFHALSLGCSVFEAHVAYDRLMFGPDSSSSLTVSEFSELANYKSNLEAFHASNREFNAIQQHTKLIFSRSIGLSRDLPPSHVITKDDLVHKKPGGYISPALESTLLGKKTNKALSMFDLPSLDDFS